jgi:hypothetical protein
MVGVIRFGAFRQMLLALVVLAALGVVATSARAATPAQAIANLNAQRAANGIPAGITENPSSSAACAAHNNYERENGGELTHSETAGNPGYTDAGNQAAGSSVLAAGTNWDTTNPWETAPIHLAQLLDPYLAQMGVDDSDGYVCATTLPPDAAFSPSPPTIVGYSYPGNGQTDWPTSETAAEGPFTPGDLVGLPQPMTTGPYLFVLFAGPWPAFSAYLSITSATLTGPSGPVAIKTADGNTPTPQGVTLGAYIGTAGMVIPVAPLTAGATYTAQVDGSVDNNGTPVPVSERFSFTTAITPQGLRAESRLTLSKAKKHHLKRVFTLRATGVYVGRSAQVTLKVGRRTVRHWTTKLAPQRTFRVVHKKHAKVSVTVPGFTVDGVTFSKITVKRPA